MLFGNESISHYTRSNVTVWMSMAFQAGLLNVGAFMACYRFVSHVTGFATHFGLEIGLTDTAHAMTMLLVPVFFLMGSMVSGLLVDLRLKMHKKPKYYLTFGIMFFLLLGVSLLGMFGFLGVFGEPVETSHNYALVILLCMVCGIQNATVTTVSKSIVRTTHLTGVTTDLGIGFVRYCYRHKLHDQHSTEGQANLMRLGIIGFFTFGSVVGAFIFRRVGFAGFLAPSLTSGVLFVVMLYFQVWRRSVPHRTPAG